MRDSSGFWRRVLTPGEAAFSPLLTRVLGVGSALVGAVVLTATLIPVAEARLLPRYEGPMRSAPVQAAQLRADTWLPRLPGWQVWRAEGVPCLGPDQMAGALMALHLRTPAQNRRIIRVYRADAGPMAALRVLWGERLLLAELRSDLSPAEIHLASDLGRQCGVLPNLVRR